jgi:predicted DNA binding CopG/RHH family protein
MTQPRIKDERIIIRVASADVKRWRAAAAADDMPLSMWIRRQCNAAAPLPSTKGRR